MGHHAYSEGARRGRAGSSGDKAKAASQTDNAIKCKIGYGPLCVVLRARLVCYDSRKSGRG